VAASGGRAAAQGLRYQYLRTIESILGRITNDETTSVLQTEDRIAEVVDFSLSSNSGGYLEVAQVKSSESATPLGGMECLKILLALTRVQSAEYRLLTNRPLRNAADSLRTLLTELKDPGRDGVSGLEQARARLGSDADMFDLLCSQDAATWERLARCRIDVDSRHPKTLFDQLKTEILTYRRRRGGGIGRASSTLLMNHLIAEIFRLSAARESRAVPLTEIAELIGLPDATLAQAHGSYEWGLPIGRLPRVPDVPRTDQLKEIDRYFFGFSLDRVPRLAVLTGLSGIGKTSIAAEYAHRQAANYDVIVWVSADDQESLRLGLQRVLGDGAAEYSVDSLQLALREHFASSTATWLIVMDNAKDAHSLHPWLPTKGHVDVLCSSINRTGWTGWSRCDVPPMSESESAQLITDRLPSPTMPDKERMAIVNRLSSALEYWPLAMEIACAHLDATGRGLHFTDDYLRTIRAEALDNQDLTPAGYRSHPTLVGAIVYALRELDQLPVPGTGPTGSEMLGSLAYLPPQDTPVFCAAQSASLYRAFTLSEDWSLPSDMQADRMIAQLRRFSLVQRSKSGPDPLDDTVTTNDVVLEIVRHRHSTEETGLWVLVNAEAIAGPLVEYLNKEAYVDFQRLVPAAVTTMGFAMALGAASNSIGTMFGHVAKFNMMNTGDFEVAKHLLERELVVLDRATPEATTAFNRLLTYHSLIQCATELNTSPDELLTLTRELIDRIDEFLGSPSGQFDQIVEVVDSLEGRLMIIARNRSTVAALFDRLAERLRTIRAAHQLPEPRLQNSNAIQDLIEKSRFEDALLIVERELMREDLRSYERCTREATKVEALAGAQRFREATEQIGITLRAIEKAGLQPNILVNSLLNPGLHIAVGSFYSGVTRGAKAFLARTIRLLYTLELGAEDAFRRAILTAVTKVMVGDTSGAAGLVRAARNMATEPSWLVKSDTPIRNMLDALSRVLELRRDGAPLLMVNVTMAARNPADRQLTALLVAIQPDDFEILQDLVDHEDVVASEWIIEPEGSRLVVRALRTGMIWIVEPEGSCIPDRARTTAVLWIPAWWGSLGLSEGSGDTPRIDQHVFEAVSTSRLINNVVPVFVYPDPHKEGPYIEVAPAVPSANTPSPDGW